MLCKKPRAYREKRYVLTLLQGGDSPLFIWDFILGDVMSQFIGWIYGQVVGFLGDFFSQMGNMGVELFEMN